MNLSCIEKDAPYIFNKDIITLIKSIVKQLIGNNKPYNFYIPQSIFRRIIHLIVEKYPILIIFLILHLMLRWSSFLFYLLSFKIIYIVRLSSFFLMIIVVCDVFFFVTLQILLNQNKNIVEICCQQIFVIELSLVFENI